MNADTGQIYRTESEVTDAERRDEPLVYGKLGVLETIQPLLLNRAQRRRAARLKARERKQ